MRRRLLVVAQHNKVRKMRIEDNYLQVVSCLVAANILRIFFTRISPFNLQCMTIAFPSARHCTPRKKHEVADVSASGSCNNVGGHYWAAAGMHMNALAGHPFCCERIGAATAHLPWHPWSSGYDVSLTR